MDPRLACLIHEYLDSIKSIVALMNRSGIPVPYSRSSWMFAKIPSTGELDGGVRYQKHGAGCRVFFNGRMVDFDFGEDGEIDEIECFRLQRFASKDMVKFCFESHEEIRKCFEDAIKSGSLTNVDDLAFYMAGQPRLRATEVDCRLPGDLLPPEAQDVILKIYAHNFLPADLMRSNYEKLDARWERRGRLSNTDEVNMRIYLFTWLGFLFEACKWFKKKNVRNLLRSERPTEFRELIEDVNVLISLFDRYESHLKSFRNSVFHLPDSEVIREYFHRDAGRIEWSNELHGRLEDFFSQYRVNCFAHYALNERKSELRSLVPSKK
ncbi:DUF6896 domain-containing protein [Pseudomonas aeruginosa]|uniref:DUF6896 domain-containing protein n=1 Tax=Pseudomonas aeruginosa TaxID=287 RepID=UPI003593FF8B